MEGNENKESSTAKQLELKHEKLFYIVFNNTNNWNCTLLQ